VNKCVILFCLSAYKEQKVKKDQSDGKTKKDAETTATTTTMSVDNDDDVEEIPEEIPDDDSVAEVEAASWIISHSDIVLKSIS